MLAENPRAVIGDNKPPLAPFEKVEKRILDLFEEASLWLDGAEVANEGQAEGIGTLLNNFRDAIALADAERVKENEPFDKGKAEVQTRYNALIADTKTQKGKAVIAITACKRALEPWLAKLEAKRQAEAAAARAEADRIARQAQEAIRTADATNLMARAEAEELIAESKKAERIAVKVENSTAKVSNAGGRAISMRTVYTHELNDSRLFAAYAWTNYRDDMIALLYNLAGTLVASGKRDIPGVNVIEEKKAV